MQRGLVAVNCQSFKDDPSHELSARCGCSWQSLSIDDNSSPDSELKKKTEQKHLLDRDCTEIMTVLTTVSVIFRDTFINDKKC
jgi:hypothetical protein